MYMQACPFSSLLCGNKRKECKKEREEKSMKRIIKTKMLEKYEIYLRNEEKSKATISKYLCDLKKLMVYAEGREIDKGLMLSYKDKLLTQDGYKASSANSFLVAANGFFEYMGWLDLKVKTYRIQRETFCPEDKILLREEYVCLVKTAKETGKTRLAMILQTICATGMRVGELEAVTVSAVRNGSVVIHNKGKIRTILLPDELRKDRVIWVILPAVVNGIGFLISAMAPGNQNRQQFFLDTKLDAAKSILYSFLYSIDHMNRWMNLWIILGLALLVPFIWKMVIKISYEWKYPGLVIILSFCIYASSYTPTLFAQGSTGAGRVQNLQYVFFILMLFADLFYLEGWIFKNLKIQFSMGENYIWSYLLSVLICLGILFIFMLNKGSLISCSAMRSVWVGEAKIYKQEADERITILKEDGKVSELSGFTVYPYVLYFDDITADKNDWRNMAMANWYGKSAVLLLVNE